MGLPESERVDRLQDMTAKAIGQLAYPRGGHTEQGWIRIEGDSRTLTQDSLV